MAGELLKFFQRQGRNAARFVRTGRKAFTDPQGVVPKSDVNLLNRILLKYETAQWEFTSGVVGPLVGVEVSEVLTREARAKMLSRAKGINDATRKRLTNLVADGIRKRQTDAQIGRRIGDVMGKPARGQMIARTELALIDQESATNRYREAGVKTVEVFDGPGCGWTTHEDGDVANGSIRTLRQAEAQPLSHPSCRRSFLPIIED